MKDVSTGGQLARGSFGQMIYAGPPNDKVALLTRPEPPCPGSWSRPCALEAIGARLSLGRG